MRQVLRGLVDVGLRSEAAERGALRLAARRCRGIALLWHRVGPAGPQNHEAVPTLTTEQFAAQLDILVELGDIVRLSDLEMPAVTRRPRFALTFDDDDSGHVTHVLPELRARDLPASFFLSGRWCHGYGPYWWQLFEEDIRKRSVEEVARAYRLDASLGPRGMVQKLTGTPAATALIGRARHEGEPPMSHEQAVTLVEAGMEIGFHTIDHQVLTALAHREQAEAVIRGREELSRDLNVSLPRFAYPHGLVDVGAETAVAEAGYVSAWTTRKHVVNPSAPPLRLGRWDVSQLPLQRLRTTLVRGLARLSR